MRELKEKIIALRFLKVAFYLLFAIGLLLFIYFAIFENVHFVRNALISLVLMASGYIFNELCNYKISEFLNDFKTLKQRANNKKSVIIEFNKIA